MEITDVRTVAVEYHLSGLVFDARYMMATKRVTDIEAGIVCWPSGTPRNLFAAGS